MDNRVLVNHFSVLSQVTHVEENNMQKFINDVMVITFMQEFPSLVQEGNGGGFHAVGGWGSDIYQAWSFLPIQKLILPRFSRRGSSGPMPVKICAMSRRCPSMVRLKILSPFDSSAPTRTLYVNICRQVMGSLTEDISGVQGESMCRITATFSRRCRYPGLCLH